jgi:hypothetical protein
MLSDSMRKRFLEIYEVRSIMLSDRFVEIYEEEKEYIISQYQGKPNPDYYSYPFFFEKFLDKDPRICKEIIPKINEFINNNPIDDKKIIKSIQDLESYLDTLLHDMGISQLDEFSKENLFAYQIAEFFYEDYKNSVNDRFSVSENNRLVELYDKHGIDLKNSRQYSKYKLINIDDNFEIKTSNVTKVYDKRLKTHLIINEISHNFLSLLKKLKDKGTISSLSLRPEYDIVGEDLLDISVILEEVECGKKFSFQDLSNPVVSKLYSRNNYDDNLWINIDSKNITFEEFLEDFQIDEKDNCIITQVVHLEYVDNSEGSFITHIDHEYIFYTLDEYEKRKTNHEQKGECKKRYKTFKVDDSKIPFELEDGDFFLYIVLDEYFKNKELLHEYFEDVLKET